MLNVRFFASLKDLIGDSELEVQLEEKTAVRDVFHQLEIRFPELKKYQPSLLVAINQEYANWEAFVSPGDELSFFPPVSGG